MTKSVKLVVEVTVDDDVDEKAVVERAAFGLKRVFPGDLVLVESKKDRDAGAAMVGLAGAPDYGWGR